MKFGSIVFGGLLNSVLTLWTALASDPGQSGLREWFVYSEVCRGSEFRENHSKIEPCIHVTTLIR